MRDVPEGYIHDRRRSRTGGQLGGRTLVKRILTRITIYVRSTSLVPSCMIGDGLTVTKKSHFEAPTSTLCCPIE